MKIVTSITVWNDAIGKRMSITYSEIDETGKIIADNKRVDRVITDSTAAGQATKLMNYAQQYIDTME